MTLSGVLAASHDRHTQYNSVGECEAFPGYL